jgi:hypothetical protein
MGLSPLANCRQDLFRQIPANDHLQRAKVGRRSFEHCTGNLTPRIAVSDEGGRFAFAGLAPGQYHLMVRKAGYLQTEFLEPLVPASMRVTLREGEQKSQDLRLASVPSKRP